MILTHPEIDCRSIYGMNPKLFGALFKLDVRSNRNEAKSEHSSDLGLLLCKDFTENTVVKFEWKAREILELLFTLRFPETKPLPIEKPIDLVDRHETFQKYFF